jgi:hypothetical protein
VVVLETLHFFPHHYRSQGACALALSSLGEPFRPLGAVTGHNACRQTPVMPHLAVVHLPLGSSLFPKCSVPDPWESHQALPLKGS